MKEVPVFLLNGFLESGKTTLIKEIIENNESYHDDSTVVVACEEGEVEYDKEWCDKYKVHVEYVDSFEEFTPEYLIDLDNKYQPQRFVIEYNSFFDFDNQELPDYMVIYQQITIIDSTTFNVMFNNMKKIFASLVKYSSLVIFNRCDGNKELATYRRWIRGLNQQAQIAFEDSKGNLTAMLDEDLPYDITKDNIHFEEDVYPTWYVDVFDNYEKYLGKTFKFEAYVRDITEYNTLVIGRRVMTCCEDDIQFLGYEVVDNSNTLVAIGDRVYVEVVVAHEYSQVAEEEVVMLHAKSITKLSYKEENIVNM